MAVQKSYLRLTGEVSLDCQKGNIDYNETKREVEDVEALNKDNSLDQFC